MITIMIPTINRSDYLIRLLNYYAEKRYRYWITIGDSSESLHLNKIKKLLPGFKKKLNIIYNEYPGLNDSETLEKLIRSVSTPYAVLLPDDDFVIPEGLEKAIGFLERHTEYNAVNGKAIILEFDGSYGKPKHIAEYGQPHREEVTASARLLIHLKNYSVTLFSVHKTDSWRAMYRNVVSLPDKSFRELLPCCLSVIQGKVKQIDSFYLVRQGHDQRYFLPDSYDWVTSADWLSSYRIFYRCLSEAIAEKDGIEFDRAQGIVKQAFWSYLYKSLTRKFQHRYGENHSSILMRMKMVLKGIPGANEYLLPAWRKLMPSIVRPDKMSLQVLLHSSSPYHKDFMPVYRAITGNCETK